MARMHSQLCLLYYVTLGKFLNLPKGLISSNAKWTLKCVFLMVTVRMKTMMYVKFEHRTWPTDTLSNVCTYSQ
jgi:hypothetical protein